MKWRLKSHVTKKKKKKEPCGYGVEVGKSCEQKNYTHCVLEKNHLG